MIHFSQRKDAKKRTIDLTFAWGHLRGPTERKKPAWTPSPLEISQFCGVWVDRSDGDVMKVVPDGCLDDIRQNFHTISLPVYESARAFLEDVPKRGYERIEPIPESEVPWPTEPREAYVKKWEWL